jgi:hypothetical protein
MRQDQIRLVSQRSPRSVRRQRQARQRSSCCCCLLVAVSLLLALIAFRGAASAWLSRSDKGKTDATPTALYPLQLHVSQSAYYRYGLIKLTATILDTEGRPLIDQDDLLVTVMQDGEPVSTIGNVTKIRLKPNRKTQEYFAYWPVPWNCEPGLYTAEAEIEIDNPDQWSWSPPQDRRPNSEESTTTVEGKAWCVSRARFHVVAAARPEFPPGTCIATWEADFRPDGIPKPEGGTGDWRTIFDWCEYLGADSLWFRGAVTETYQGSLTMEQPFKAYNLQAIPKLGAEAHRRGLKFGVWTAAYATYPKQSNRNKPQYLYAKDVSRSTGKVSDLEFVSLLDEHRIEHLARFAADMQAMPEVDYIGFDYFRSDRGGYEMVERFAAEMPVRLPSNWDSMNANQRMLYFAKAIEGGGWQKNADVYDCWNWWRAHLGASNLLKIRQKSGVTKPLWIFLLSWRHGVQHGQDPLMLTDAGVTVLAPMLYQVPGRAHFDTMVKEWNEYLNADQVNLAVGDQVDFYWHQKTLNPAAPDELYDRIVTAHRDYEPGEGFTRGAFWHDISRAALGGSRGPYPGSEWALAGAAAFTTVRNNWKVYPIRATMQQIKRTGGSQFVANVAIENISDTQMDDISAYIMKTPNIAANGRERRAIKSLGPGETITVPFEGHITAAAGDRANRFMVAIRLTWPAGEYGEQFRADLPRQQTVMKYVALGSGG